MATYGFLRVRCPDDASLQDVSVLLSSASQLELATADVDTELLIRLTTQDLPGAGTYNENVDYALLSSGGFALKVESHKFASKAVYITGTKVVT